MSPTGLHASAVASSLLTAGLLVPVQLLVRPPMLLAERFVPGLGWAEVGLLAIYAGWMTSRILRPREGIRWRQRLWRLFSLVFFLQLALGLGGVAECLMSGQLHLPVPALIVAGPVFRGEGLFMPILLGSTLLLTGPGWCSHLCYIGAWDDLCAVSGPRRPRPLPAWRNLARLCILGGVLAVAVLLRAADAPAALAGVLAGLFGVAGVGVMVLSSRHSGAMVHCASWCPIGWLTTTLGRLSPFRVRLDRGCVGCGLCAAACRYDALNPAHIARGRVGSNCTLCGDCLEACHSFQLRYSFPGLSPAAAQGAYRALVVGLHAVFLGVARM